MGDTMVIPACDEMEIEEEDREELSNGRNDASAFEKDKQYRLIMGAREGDPEALDELVRNNLGLVKSVAHRFTGYGYEWDDLIQIGSIGLVKAIKRFDMSFQVMFSTYAMPLILGEIKRYIRDDGRIKVSRELKSGIIRMKTVRERLMKEEGASPRLSQLAEELQMDVNEVLVLMEAEHSINSMGSLDDPESFEKDERDKRVSNGEEELVDKILLSEIIENLPHRERQIIILRYYKDMTQSEIAKILGISQVHVSRLEKRTLSKIGASFGQYRQPACQEG